MQDNRTVQPPTRETILLVEDDPIVRRLLVQVLTRAGYRIYEAADGRAAVEVFDRYGDTVDLLLTDLRMPVMGGAELALQLRAKRPSVKLLCVSGYPGTEGLGQCADFLSKPFSRDGLLAKVRQVLDKK